MDQIGKLDRVLDEEHRDVVADQIPVACAGVELDREATHVARRIHGARAAGHGGEAREHRGAFSGFAQKGRRGVFLQRLGQFEVPVRTAAARMHDALGNALVIEVGDLLAEDEILEQGRSLVEGTQRILVVDDRDPLFRRQGRMTAARRLVKLAAVAGVIGTPQSNGLDSGWSCCCFLRHANAFDCWGPEPLDTTWLIKIP